MTEIYAKRELVMDFAPDIKRMVEDYGDDLLRLCYLYLKDVHLAEDAVQDTFLQIYRHYDSFRGESSEKTWVTRIAINICKNYLKSPWRRRVAPDDALLQTIAAPAFTAHDNTVIKAVMALPPKYKDVILLYYYREMKIREIAELLEIPESTVSVRLMRAKERLQAALKGWYFDE